MLSQTPTFKDKVVLITGAGGGIGRAHALAFAREGAMVVVNDVGGTRDGSGTSTSMADAVVAEIREMGGKAAAHYESIATMEGAQSLLQTALSAFGRADVLVNNAGILRDKTLLKMDESMWDSVIAVHLKGSFCCSQSFARYAVEAGHGGRIINTTSYAGLIGNFGQANYSAAKAGIYGLTVTAALELRSKGITVNAVAPMAKTRMTTDVDMIPEEMLPEQISPLVLYLASDAAAEITGKTFGVHGQQIFSYVMKMYDGVTKAGTDFWTPQEIASRIGDIVREYRAADGPPAAAPALVAAAAPVSAGDPVEQAFSLLPFGLVPEKAAGKKFNIFFDIKGGVSHSIVLADGALKVEKGQVGTPTCKVDTDAETIVGMFGGKIKPESAFMQGKIKATNLADMMAMGQVLSFKKAAEAMAARGAQAPAPAALAPAPAAQGGDPVTQAFSLLPHGFVPEKASGKKFNIFFDIKGGPSHSIILADGVLKVEVGTSGTPTCKVDADADTVVGMFSGKIKPESAFMQGKIKATNLADMMTMGQVLSFKKAAEVLAARGGLPAAASAPAAAPTSAPASSGDPVADAFALLPLGFVPEKAAGKKFKIFFDIKGGTGHSIVLADGGLSVVKGAVDGHTCKVDTDVETILGMFSGKIKPESAFMQGRIKATNLGDMMAMGQVLSFKKAAEAMAGQGGVVPAAAQKGNTGVAGPAGDPVKTAFARLPENFKKDKAGSWKATLHFEIKSGTSHTLAVAEGAATVTEGLTGTADCIIKTDSETIAGLLTGKVDGQKAFMQGKITATNMGLLMKFSQFFTFQAPPPPSAAPVSAPAEVKKDIKALVGRKYDGGVAFARPADMIQYALAVNESNPAFIDEKREGGIIGHPIFPVRLFNDCLYKVATDPDLELDLVRLVHGEQDMRFLLPIHSMDLLNVRAQLYAVQEKESGTTITGRIYAYQDGRLAVEAFSTLFIRARARKKEGEAKGSSGGIKLMEESRATGDIVLKESFQVDKDQALRYADASQDRNPIHVDEDAARAAGLPGVILHGLCTMAMSTRPFIMNFAGGDPTRLKRFAVRFSKPVHPGDLLTIQAWKENEKDGMMVYGFEVTNQKGMLVITQGVAEIAGGQSAETAAAS